LLTAFRSADQRARAWTLAALILITAYGALLRLDAFVAKYGTLDHPSWARIATQNVAPVAAHLRPSGVAFARVPHPYVGGDPITYLKFGREMRSFYQAHVREPVFLALTRFSLWTLHNQDAGVSLASAIGSLLIVLGTYLLGAALSSRPAGLIAALVIAIEYEVITWAVDGWRDDTFTAAFVFTAWALVRLRDRPSFTTAIVLGVTGGLACLTRITALSFILPALAWIVLDGHDGRALRVRYALAALGMLAVVVVPYLVSCAIATGDPFLAINYHTTYYRFSEGISIAHPMTAGEYLRLKFATHPVATMDVGFIGLFVRPFVTKWNGLNLWWPWLGTIAQWCALLGLAMWPFSTRGRLLLVILISSLLPYAFTWNIGGGGEWRFTMHAYPIYVIAAVYAVTAIVHPWWRASLRPLRWRAAIVAGAAVAGTAVFFGAPWLVAREAIVKGEEVNIEAGQRDRVFYRRGWSALRQDGAVTSRVSLDSQATVHVPLPAKRDYHVVLRFDPVAPDTQHRVTVLLNRQLLGTLLTGWNPERVGTYPLVLPAGSVHAGDNAITLVADTLVAAGEAGARYTWMKPDARIGVRLWYVRVLD